jgi:hypothetical protein
MPALAEDYVVVTLQEQFNAAAPLHGVVRENDFLNGLAAMIAKRDPVALRSEWPQISGLPYRAQLRGDQRRIERALADIFRHAQQNGDVEISGPSAVANPQDVGVYDQSLSSPVHAMTLTVKSSLYDFVVKQNLPIPRIDA